MSVRDGHQLIRVPELVAVLLTDKSILLRLRYIVIYMVCDNAEVLVHIRKDGHQVLICTATLSQHSLYFNSSTRIVEFVPLLSEWGMPMNEMYIVFSNKKLPVSFASGNFSKVSQSHHPGSIILQTWGVQPQDFPISCNCISTGDDYWKIPRRQAGRGVDSYSSYLMTWVNSWIPESLAFNKFVSQIISLCHRHSRLIVQQIFRLVLGAVRHKPLPDSDCTQMYNTFGTNRQQGAKACNNHVHGTLISSVKIYRPPTYWHICVLVKSFVWLDQGSDSFWDVWYSIWIFHTSIHEFWEWIAWHHRTIVADHENNVLNRTCPGT